MRLQSHFWAYIQKKNMVRKDTCIPMFIAALFTIAKTWKQTKCPSTEEWIKKCGVYIYTMEYYLATENYKIRPFAATWLDLEVVILSEMSDRERKVLYDMAYIKNLK